MKVIVRPIEMISWTDKQGIIHPIKFRIENKDGQNQTYSIVKDLKMDQEKLAGNIMFKYTCAIVVNGIEKICEIRYERDTCLWTLFKI